MARYSTTVRKLLNKSVDAVILAVDIYNKPATRFRSHGFVVMMIIGWTSLFHAIFERDKIKYFYKEKNSNRYKYIDGEKKAWELSECARQYYKSNGSAQRANLEFFIRLRNQIEHRFLPAIDLDIIGECQALLINFEKILVLEFGDDYSLSESLAIPLQLLTVNPEWRATIMRELQSREYETVKNYIDTYRASLEKDISVSLEYSFRVFLIPQIGNHESSSDLSIEFIPFDSDKSEEMEQYQKLAAFIKSKNVQVQVKHAGRLKAGDVCQRIKDQLKIKFHPSSHHVACWKYFKARPSGNSEKPEQTDARYCHYDVVHNDYVYTEAWVELLLTELADIQEREKILKTR